MNGRSRHQVTSGNAGSFWLHRMGFRYRVDAAMAASLINSFLASE